jgi:curved DNA-binding protein CbpA
MRKWFVGVKTVEELRKRYRELQKMYHPDNENGSVEVTQEINAEYDLVFLILSREKQEDSQSYTQEENEQFKAILNEITGFNMTVQIIGSWIWCFDCYQYRDQLKGLGFKWCSKKRAWVWHSESYRRHHKQEIPLSDIKAKYGCQTVRNQSYNTH